MGVEAGALDREITIQTATTSTDATTGAELVTWGDDQVVWAQWLQSGTREAWQARQIDSEIDGVYRVHGLDSAPSVETTQVIGHDGRTYDVVGVVEIGRGEGYDIAVKAGGEAA